MYFVHYVLCTLCTLFKEIEGNKSCNATAIELRNVESPVIPFAQVIPFPNYLYRSKSSSVFLENEVSVLKQTLKVVKHVTFPSML